MSECIRIDEPDWNEMERLYSRSETEEEFKARMAVAAERGRIAEETEPRAASVRYNAESGRVEIELKDGCLFAFPTHIAQDLRGVAPELLANPKILGGGYAIHWDKLNVGFPVAAVVSRRFGNDRWMEMLLRERREARGAA